MTTLPDMATPKKPKHVSRMCQTGKHNRCLGTVYTYPPEGGTHIVDCACSVADCGHGTDHAKAKARRG